MGGEHTTEPVAVTAIVGSSPRGRGTHGREQARPRSVRVIPAWAGNTHARRSRPCRGSGHPRVGGEHFGRDCRAASAAGSSPRGRGTPSCHRDAGGGNRVIPAWAGNTPDDAKRNLHQAGHPRVGGEHSQIPARTLHGFGSSPRGRGTRMYRNALILLLRVIPAWAGNTADDQIHELCLTGHPRVGGEHRTMTAKTFIPGGSSPRGRGTRNATRLLFSESRVIPAWAGNT